MLRIGSLCTGFGGVELGIGSVEPAVAAWHAEVDPDASAVLGHHWPEVPNLGDARNAVTAERVDLIAAGFPCQPVSAAGRQLADADPRWLWPVVRDVIDAQRPAAVFLENVRNIVSIRKGEILALILSDLRAMGYACRWTILGACAVGAAHHRHRWFLYGRLVGAFGCPPAEEVKVETCGARRGKAGRIFPTPRARDGLATGGGVGSAGYWSTRDHRLMQLPAAVAVLLPTPQARDGDSRGAPTPELAAQRIADRKNLDDAVISTLAGPMLPTPTATQYGSNQGGAAGRSGPVRPSLAGAMLPTPSRADGVGGHVNRSGARAGEVLLGGIGKLLPTPRASDGENGRGNPNQHGGRGESDPSMGMAVQAEHFGRYTEAVARQTDALGLIPPAPTEPNTKGNPRLNPAFAEWLMGLQPGHVTAHAERNASLRMIGNGAMPQQVAAAWLILTKEGSPMDTSTEPTPPADPEAVLEQQPADTPYGTETALASDRATLRAASAVFTEIGKSVEFHENAQVVRDVFGTIERMATEASKHQPKWRRSNGCPEFAELNPQALRQLAALCRVYLPGGDALDLTPSITGHTPADVEQGMKDMLDTLAPGALKVEINGEDVTEHVKDSAAVVAEIERIEESVRAEREHAGGTVETANPPDPFSDPAPVVDVSLFPPLGAPVRFTDILSDPFSNPAPIAQAAIDEASGGEAPF